MNTAVARKRIIAPTAPTMGPATTVEVSAPSEISQVLMDQRRYPSPVRPVGSASSVSEIPGWTVTRSPSIFSMRFIFDRSS